MIKGNGNYHAVEITKVSKKYHQTTALDNVYLCISQGEICGIVGPNAAGKSTLLKIIIGLVHADSGSVLTLNYKMPTRDAKLRRFVAYLDETRTAYANMKVSRYISMCSRMYPCFDDSLSSKMIERFRIPWGAYIETLSMGQRALICLTSVCSQRALLTVLDEPFCNLDPLMVEVVRAEMIPMLIEQGNTVIIATHYLDELLRTCTHMIVLQQGRIVLDSPTFKLLHKRGNSYANQDAARGLVLRLLTETPADGCGSSTYE